MPCIVAKFGTGTFGVSKFGNLCVDVPVTPIYERNFTRHMDIASRKLGNFSKKIY